MNATYHAGGNRPARNPAAPKPAVPNPAGMGRAAMSRAATGPVPAGHGRVPRQAAASAPPPRARGSTALRGGHHGLGQTVGSALRAIGVFLDTAFRVTVLGPGSVKQ
jgi:hypothetical protein